MTLTLKIWSFQHPDFEVTISKEYDKRIVIPKRKQ